MHTQKEKSIRKPKLSQKEIDNSMKSKDKKGVREKQVGALLSTASGTPISAIAAKQINQIPTVLHQVLSLSSSSLVSMKKIKNLSTQIKQKEPNTHVKQKWPRWKVHSCILPSCGRATKMTVIRLERSKMKRTGSPLWVFKCSMEHLPLSRQPSRAEANPPAKGPLFLSQWQRTCKPILTSLPHSNYRTNHRGKK